MAMRAGELKKWLANISDRALVAIDDGGLTVVLVSDPDGNYIGVGGIPEAAAEGRS